jgi:AraC-like DNA-binding protein
MQILATHGVLGFANEAWLTSGRIDDHLPALIRAAMPGKTEAADADAKAMHVGLMQAIGQQLLLLERTDDAADFFERSIKALPLQASPEHQTRACLIAGLQSQHRHQTRTAWNCLQRTLEAKHCAPQVRVQAHAAVAALYFSLGMRRPAAAAVDRAMDLLASDPQPHVLPQLSLRALQAEFVVLDLLRQHERLHDLVFWPRQEAVAGSRVTVARAREAIQRCRADAEPYRFLHDRLAFLDGLIDVAFDGVPRHASLLAHIQRLNEGGLALHVMGARHELALACIAAQHVDPLRQLMLCYAGAGRQSAALVHQLDHEYCLAKLGELSGREDLYIAHYRAYAQQALGELRQTCAYITVPTMVRQAVSEIPKDDIASRLPGKYRRAYQYILANLHREDLSVHDVADAVGVTERALQLAFRAALGVSPSAVIRQCRMDRVRNDLSSGAVGHGTTTLDVGRRWGVRSRSALAQAYKASFGELPSQTFGAALE